MNTVLVIPAPFGPSPGPRRFRALTSVGQHILNSLTAAAQRAADRSRFAGLPRRYLDDVDMTPAERELQIPHVEPVEAPSALVHSV